MEWLSEHLDRWVSAGLVSPDQAQAINRFEALPPASSVGGEPPRRLSLVAEAVSYLGIALMAASGALVTARFWDDLRVGGRLAVGLAVILAGFAGAAVVGRIGDEGSRRLASFLQLLGTGGVALTAGVIAVAAGSNDAGVTALAAGPPALLVSVALWQNRERVLPFLSALAAAVATVIGISTTAGLSPTTTEKALAVWVVAVALGLLSGAGKLHPVLPALLVAEIASLVAALFVVNPHHAPGLVIGLLTALTGLLAGMLLDHRSVETIGVIGCLVFLGYTLAIYVKGPAGMVAILVLGAVLVVLAIRAGLHRKGAPPSPGSHIGRPHFR